MTSNLKTMKKNSALLFRTFGTKSTVQSNLTYFLSLFLADGIPVSVSIMSPDHPLFLQPFYLIFLIIYLIMLIDTGIIIFIAC